MGALWENFMISERMKYNANPNAKTQIITPRNFDEFLLGSI
jgi:hypothetical protein